MMFFSYLRTNNETINYVITMIVLSITSGILACLLIILLVRQYLMKRQTIEKDGKIQDVNVYKDNFDLVINVVTVLVGVFTIVTGLVSIHVMISQDKTQKELIRAQKMEHQPTFQVTLSEFPAEEGGPNVYQEYSITNIGEQMSSPADVTCHSYLKISYADVNNPHEDYFLISPFFYVSFSSGALKGDIIHSACSSALLNLQHYNALRYMPRPSICTAPMSIELVHTFSIAYIDIYGENKEVFFMNEKPISSEEYRHIEDYAHSSWAVNNSIAEITQEDIVLALIDMTTQK